MASHAATTAGLRAAPLEHQARPLFSTYEAIAIQLGANDPLRSAHDGRVRQWIDRLLGARRPPRLADARLEALRLLTLKLRHRPRHGVGAELHAARHAGVSDRQIEAVAAAYGGTTVVRRH
jgi:hypothetical protein